MALKKNSEESIPFYTNEGVFYNPKMQFCRSMSSLAVGAIAQDLEVIDAFCASGIRGIRYAKENSNVKLLTSIDIDKGAIALVKKNSKLNKLKSTTVLGNISKAAFDYVGDLVELDPFGTPSPYVLDAMRYFNPKKVAYISATATDVAVLCGAKVAACMKNYHSKPLNCFFTHEIGLRILIKRIVEVASEFNFGCTPLVSFSDQHYLKTVIKLTRSADLADESLNLFGYICLCEKCGYVNMDKFPSKACNHCQNTKISWAGPLWLGKLHEGKFLTNMKTLNDSRNYVDKQKIANFLSLFEGEIDLPPFYYNLHQLCKTHKTQPVPNLVNLLKTISEKGFIARKSHFSPLSIKTNAPYSELVRILKTHK